MKNTLSLVAVLGLLFLVASPSSAAFTGEHSIKTFKVENGGLLFELDGFTENDVDPAACATPGGPYLWLSSSEANYEELFATLLSAFLSGAPVNVSYYECGTYAPPATPYVRAGSVTLKAS